MSNVSDPYLVLPRIQARLEDLEDLVILVVMRIQKVPLDHVDQVLREDPLLQEDQTRQEVPEVQPLLVVLDDLSALKTTTSVTFVISL